MAYQALLTEGRVAEQERLLNRDRLIELWPVINLDQRVRDLWNAFPNSGYTHEPGCLRTEKDREDCPGGGRPGSRVRAGWVWCHS